MIRDKSLRLLFIIAVFFLLLIPTLYAENNKIIVDNQLNKANKPIQLARRAQSGAAMFRHSTARRSTARRSMTVRRGTAHGVGTHRYHSRRNYPRHYYRRNRGWYDYYNVIVPATALMLDYLYTQPTYTCRVRYAGRIYYGTVQPGGLCYFKVGRRVLSSPYYNLVYD